MAGAKPQRVRDPLHNLISFDGGEFEDVLWRVIQTRPFQRLRRIKQLAFAELVFPGATHNRFSHSLGVFHTARQLMQIIKLHEERGFKDAKARVALAAALVHDVGHGMFSHAFEDVGKRLELKMARHESVSDQLIRSGEISEILKELGSGFDSDVADVIKQGRPSTVYTTVVSSQFDADRLDYMQRDRLMAGVQNSGIDFTWLIANLEIGKVRTGVDEQGLDDIETFVLGPKASYAAETYVLALFQLYPTLYFHKGSRGAEKLFSTLMVRTMTLAREGHIDKTGLPAQHPIIRFALEPEHLDRALALDDSVFWGALSMLADSTDEVVRVSSGRLLERHLLKAIDVRSRLHAEIGPGVPKSPGERLAKKQQIDRLTASIVHRLEAWSRDKSGDGIPRVLLDRASRHPYKRLDETKGPLNQILMRSGAQIVDVAESSSVVAALEPFELFRAYVAKEDSGAREAVEQIIATELKGGGK